MGLGKSLEKFTTYSRIVVKDILAFLWFVGIQRGGKNV